MPKTNHTSTDLQGLTRLLTEATIGTTDVVESMHQRIVHPPFLPSTPIQHLVTKIAGLTYRNIKRSAHFIGKGTDSILGQFGTVLGTNKDTSTRAAIRSALNGVLGDYLEASDNPLAIDMQFRCQGNPIALTCESIQNTYPKINGKILLMVHGSSMSDLQWTRKGHNHGESLAKELGITPVYLHYNSGRHISTNGKAFSSLLEKLIGAWPVPVEEITLIAHSMGGLVVRSALHYGQAAQKEWTKNIRKMVFLGTPHHGAPLEKVGNYLDNLLEFIPYTKPLARLGKIRSAGVTDLRYGNLVDEDWQDQDRFKLRGDQRQHIALPEQIDCYSIAGTKGKVSDSLSARLVGDGLVGVPSALGQHKDPAKMLYFKKENICVVHECTHLDLLSNVVVYEQLKDWLV